MLFGQPLVYITKGLGPEMQKSWSWTWKNFKVLVLVLKLRSWSWSSEKSWLYHCLNGVTDHRCYGLLSCQFSVCPTVLDLYSDMGQTDRQTDRQTDIRWPSTLGAQRSSWAPNLVT